MAEWSKAASATLPHVGQSQTTEHSKPPVHPFTHLASHTFHLRVVGIGWGLTAATTLTAGSSLVIGEPSSSWGVLGPNLDAVGLEEDKKFMNEQKYTNTNPLYFPKTSLIRINQVHSIPKAEISNTYSNNVKVCSYYRL